MYLPRRLKVYQRTADRVEAWFIYWLKPVVFPHEIL
jgi:hypothetical protein